MGSAQLNRRKRLTSPTSENYMVRWCSTRAARVSLNLPCAHASRDMTVPGASCESGITESSRNFGHFQVSIVRMHDDLLQKGLLKCDKKRRASSPLANQTFA